jgi:hypothetical protein
VRRVLPVARVRGDVRGDDLGDDLEGRQAAALAGDLRVLLALDDVQVQALVGEQDPADDAE